MKVPSILHNKKGQELNKLYSFVLLIVLVGMIIGVGVITFEKTAEITYYDVTNYNDTVDLTANNTAVQLDWGNITSVDRVVNATPSAGSGGILSSDCYRLENHTSSTPKGKGYFIYLNSSAACGWNANFADMDITLIYDAKNYDTETRDAMGFATTEVSGIASNWLGLIVTVFVLSIILFLVVRSFGGAQR